MRKLSRAAIIGAVATTLLATPIASAQEAPLAIEDESITDERLVEIPEAPIDRFIVTYTDEAQNDEEVRVNTMSVAADEAASPVDNVEEVREREDGTVVIEVDEPLTNDEAEAFMEEMLQSDEVEFIEPDVIMTTMAVSDQYYDYQWPFHGRYGGYVEGAWNRTSLKGDDQVVAVVDSGITNHPDLQGQLVPGYDFISDPWMARDGGGRDNNPADNGDWFGPWECGNNPQGSSSSWHGTHVAGTIAAATDNGIGVAGVAPNAVVQPIRALGKCGGYSSDIADAIIWASGGNVAGVPQNPTPASVINLSLGGNGQCLSAYQNAINQAKNNGAIVVAAAGNENQNVANVMPANCGGVITVGATAETGRYASYSNYGNEVDISAPGGDFSQDNGVLSTLNSGTTTPGSPNYAYYQGTSMATPFVSGVVAMMLAENPSLNTDQVRQILQSTSLRFNGSCYGCGAGIVDAEYAVLAVQ